MSYEKAAHIVPAYLQCHGYEISPINPTTDEIVGKQAYDSLADVTGTIDIVEIFRSSEEVLEIIEQALTRDDVRAIWMQLGIWNDKAARAAEAAGLTLSEITV